MDYEEMRNRHCLFFKFRANEFTVIVIYKSPQYSVVKFRNNLESMLQGLSEKTFFIGDINIDLSSEKNVSIPKLFEKYGFKTCLDLKHASTDYGTHIDICFSNSTEIQAWFYESYYSYHKAICVIWPKQ